MIIVFVFALVLEISSLGQLSFVIQDKSDYFKELKSENEFLVFNYSDYILDNKNLTNIKESLNLIPTNELVYLDTYNINSIFSYND